MSTITLRPAVPDDARALLAIYAPYIQNTAITFERDVPTEADFRARIEHTLAFYPYLVAERDGKPVGYAYASRFSVRAAYDWSAELSIYLAPEGQKQGIARQLYEVLEAALKKMGITNLYAKIASPDQDDCYLTHNSVDFHQHMGFSVCGQMKAVGSKFGRWYNLTYMEKIIAGHEANPRPVEKWDGSILRR